MKLYTFQKKVRSVTNYLNLHDVPFRFKSSNSSHALMVPFVWPSSVEGWFSYPTSQFKDLVKSCGLCVVKEYDYLLIF